MRPKEIKNLIKKIYTLPPHQRRPIFIWGPPGVGKSSIVKQVCEELNIGFIDLRLALLEPVDLRGVPFIKKDSENGEKTVFWARPVFLPSEGQGILFLDEVPAAPPAIQATSYQLVFDRCVGEHKLGDGWYIVAAGNRETDAAVSYRVPSPLRNRFIHVEYELTVDDWSEWAIPRGIHPHVIGFVNFRRDLLFNFNPNSAERAFATPRTWEFVSDLLHAGVFDSETIGGCVGSGVAVEFLAYVKLQEKMPNIEDILNGNLERLPQYDKTEMPGIQHSIIASVCSKISEVKNNDKRKLMTDNAFRFAMDNFEPEFVVLAVKRLKIVYPNIQNCSTFPEFVKKYKEVVL